MNLKYDIPKLQELLKDFYNITHIDSEMVNKDLNQVTGYGSCGPFCTLLRETPCGKKECAYSDRLVLEQCRDKKEPVIHVCHAGLLDIAIPILKDGEAMGYILFGHIRNQRSFGEIYERVRWITDDYDSLKTEFSKLIYYDDSQVKSIINLVTGITTMIISLNLIQEEYFTLTKQLATYVEQHYTGELSVEQLCKEFHISKNALYAHFRVNYQCTVAEYITQKRIAKAKQLLAETDLPITEIAEQSGIGDYTYFFKLIKKYTGKTPSQVRKESSR